jgi:3-oxoadipate enol-lactonase
MKLTIPNQLELSYHESGRGPSVILVHAFPLSRSLWTSTIRALSPLYHVLAPDLIGFGDSPLSAPLATSIERYGDHLIALFEEKRLTQAVFVGCSLGGYILFSLYQRYPSLFRGLVLVGTKATIDPPEVQKIRIENAAIIEESNPAEFYENMLLRLVGATTQHTRPGVVAAARRMMSQASSFGVAAALRAMANRVDFTATLASIQTPTLVITGEEDLITPPAEARAMAAAIKRGSFAMIPKSGHLPSLEAPESFQDTLLSFLSTLR